MVAVVVGTEIHFVCKAKHGDAATVPSSLESPVTLHEGQWAYCARAARTGHMWEAIPPVSLSELKLTEVARGIP